MRSRLASRWSVTQRLVVQKIFFEEVVCGPRLASRWSVTQSLVLQKIFFEDRNLRSRLASRWSVTQSMVLQKTFFEEVVCGRGLTSRWSVTKRFGNKETKMKIFFDRDLTAGGLLMEAATARKRLLGNERFSAEPVVCCRA